MHAAVDVNCLAAQSPTGYWNLVDYIHHNAEDIGSDPNAKPDDTKAPKRRPSTPSTAPTPSSTSSPASRARSRKSTPSSSTPASPSRTPPPSKPPSSSAPRLNVESTPTYFINGEKYEGALPLDYVFGQIDDALRAQGATPPPPYVAPAPPAADATNPAPGN